MSKPYEFKITECMSCPFVSSGTEVRYCILYEVLNPNDSLLRITEGDPIPGECDLRQKEVTVKLDPRLRTVLPAKD